MAKSTPAIFSREPTDMYQWLINLLLTISAVKDVRHVLITNDFFKFQDEAVKCNFAILYHSKKRGRLNVTDVTDSLYDRELQYLNETHGKKRVLVVMDDLDDGSDDVKMELLRAQPSIKELAEELFIFSTEEKANLKRQGEGGYQSQPEHSNKLDRMKIIIEGSQQGLSRSITPGIWGEGNKRLDTRRDLESGWLGRLQQRCSPPMIAFIIIGVVIALLIIVLSITLHH